MYTNTNTIPLYIGIDIGKNVHSFGAYAGANLSLVHAAEDVHSNKAGFEHFQKWIQGRLNKYHPITIGLEPTGIYHEPWVYAIRQAYGNAVTLKFLNPYQTKQKRKQLQNGRSRKTDPIDVEAIAHCLRDGQGSTACLAQKQEAQFQLWMTEYHQVKKRRQRLLTNLSTQMDRLWPGALVDVRRFKNAHPDLEPPTPLLLSRPFDRQLLQVIIEHRPNPHDWKHQSLEAIEAFFRQHGRRCGPKTAQKVSEVVNHALLLPSYLTGELAIRLQEDFSLFQRVSQRLDMLKRRAEDLVPHTKAAVLTTFSGISHFLAAQYLAYVIDPARFDHADQIWALAGFDPGRNDSGDRRFTGEISRRGQPGLRSTLYQIGLNTSQRCSVIRKCKQRALQRGKGRVGATVHAAHKANRICFHLLAHQVAFDPTKAR